MAKSKPLAGCSYIRVEKDAAPFAGLSAEVQNACRARMLENISRQMAEFYRSHPSLWEERRLQGEKE